MDSYARKKKSYSSISYGSTKELWLLKIQIEECLWRIIPIPSGIKKKVIQLLKEKMAAGVYEARLPPSLDDFVEPFAGRKVYTIGDLHWGFDAHKVDTSSRDLTSFHTPLGLL
ncbi:hypothetical protein SCP_0313170 [Sparassis crispa]|uniref:Uncharacterized protein n=1 Tax=Sparassis crispa TaxID=139825 RepID=A0A401GHE9_9APHY|nr:hypothetical protein SCP_0313170 [Sparassis crispa]GBE81588.1 hypothetical protein SCP_0313170 [Sparassis crispa]